MSTPTFDDGSYRFSPINDDDHAGYIWIVTILGLIYSGLGGLTRARIKWGVHGADDYLLGIATVILFGQSIAVIYGLNKGLAKSNAITPESDWALSGKSFFASEILSIIILCLTKCSVVLLIFRVFTIEIDRTWLLCLSTLIMSAVWGLASLVTMAINCDADTILTTKEATTCPDQYARWQAITAVDAITEIFICALPVTFIWSTNMSRYIKLQVFLAFAFRLPLVYLTVYHFQLLASYLASSQPQFAISGGLILQQVMLTYSLISATIPNLKSFMKSFSVGMGVSIGFIRSDLDDSSNNHHHHHQYPVHSFGVHSRSTGTRSQRRRGDNALLATGSGEPGHTDDDDGEGHEMGPILRPDRFQHQVTIKGSPADDRFVGTAEEGRAHSRHGSQDMIIKREVVWNVHHEQLSGPSQ